jgi:hypothetical protein
MVLLLVILQKMAFYGCIGVLIEFFFTGVYNLFDKSWKLTGYSYLWMVPIYTCTGMLLELVKASVPWPFYSKAFIYLIIIYGVEFLSGLLIKKVTALLQNRFGGSDGNKIPWEYEKSAWTVMGLINLKYLPFWFILCLLFEPISDTVSKVAYSLLK